MRRRAPCQRWISASRSNPLFDSVIPPSPPAVPAGGDDGQFERFFSYSRLRGATFHSYQRRIG